MLNLDLATIAFQVINFLVLAALLYRFLFRPVMRAMRERADERERLRREIAQKHQDATNLRADLEARLAHAEEEAATIIAEAHEQAQAEQAALLQETEAEVERILVEAHADAHRLRQQAAHDFHDDLLNAIMEISGQVIGRITPPEVHDALVQQLNDRIWELGRSEMERVEAFRRSLGDRTPTAHVTCARPLSPEQQGMLARTITAFADRRVNIEMNTDPNVVAGMRVRIGDLMVDNSIAGQLDELRASTSQALKEHAGHE